MLKIAKLDDFQNLTLSPVDLIAWPDAEMYTENYIGLLPEVPLKDTRPGDIAWYKDKGKCKSGCLTFITHAQEYFDKHNLTFFAAVYEANPTTPFNLKHWQVISKSTAGELHWRRPVREYWEGRPTNFVTIGGHDCDFDGIYSGMDPSFDVTLKDIYGKTSPIVKGVSITMMIAGAALIGVGGYYGHHAQQSFDDFKKMPMTVPYYHERQADIISSAHTANVYYSVGGAILGVGSVILITDLIYNAVIEN